MMVCVYDNPNTMAREAWQYGRLLGHTTATMLCTKGFYGHPKWPFIFNVGPWTPGQLIGDIGAMNGHPTSK